MNERQRPPVINPSMKRVNLYLPVRLVDRLHEIAEATGISMSEHARNGIARYILTFDREVDTMKSRGSR